MYPDTESATTSQNLAPDSPALRGGTFAEVAEEIRHREASRVVHKLGLSPKAERDVVSMTRSLVNQLVEGPIAKAVALAGTPRLGTTHSGRSDAAEEHENDHR